MTREAEAIDWSAPIEAYHPDGRVVALVCYEYAGAGPHFTKPRSSTEYVSDLPSGWDDEGRYWDKTDPGDKWRIRNRKPAQQWGDPLDPELVDQMVRLVRDMERQGVDCDVNTNEHYNRADAIAAELPPEPVDPVVARAREIVAGETDGSVATSFRSGERDSVPAMRAVIRALREGMGE